MCVKRGMGSTQAEAAWLRAGIHAIVHDESLTSGEVRRRLLALLGTESPFMKPPCTEPLEELAVRISLARCSCQADPYASGLTELSSLMEKYITAEDRLRYGAASEFAAAHRDYTLVERDVRTLLAKVREFAAAGMPQAATIPRGWWVKIWRCLTW